MRPARVSRLPLRVRLVSGFSTAMLVVLTAAGVIVYWRVHYALDRGLDTDLDQATSALARLLTPDGRIGDASAAAATGVVWQLLDSDGVVLEHSDALGVPGVSSDDVMVTPAQLATVGQGSLRTDVGTLLPAVPTPLRLAISRVETDEYLVVAVRRDHRDEALRELLLQLALAGLGALVLTAVVGDQLARAALAPVERYRRQAASIAEGASGVRLEVPPGRDDEVTRLGLTLNHMLTALERAVEHERRFVDDASHELRTPLTLLRSRVDLARRRPRSVAEHEATLAELAVDIERLGDLAQQLLTLGSSGAGAPGHLDAAWVLAGVVERRRLADPEAAAQLVVRLPGDDQLIVAASALQLERLVENLLDNALRHGLAPVGLSLEAVVDDRSRRWARIVVDDHGSGMDPEMLHTATQRFARSPEARSRPGSGLGLSLVESTVHDLGGELRLCARGQHARFGTGVSLPCTHENRMSVTVLLPSEPLDSGARELDDEAGAVRVGVEPDVAAGTPRDPSRQ